MQFEQIDFAIVVIIVFFILYGLWFGLIRTLGSLLGMLFGVFFATHLLEPAEKLLFTLTGIEGNIARFVLLTVLFILIGKIIGFLFWIIDRLLDTITRLPFLQGINRIAGGFLGALEGIVVIGFVTFFALQFPFSPSYAEKLANSSFAQYSLGVVEFVMPLLPDGLEVASDQLVELKNLGSDGLSVITKSLLNEQGNIDTPGGFSGILKAIGGLSSLKEGEVDQDALDKLIKNALEAAGSNSTTPVSTIIEHNNEIDRVQDILDGKSN